jgi:hypothetical protein
MDPHPKGSTLSISDNPRVSTGKTGFNPTSVELKVLQAWGRLAHYGGFHVC